MILIFYPFPKSVFIVVIIPSKSETTQSVESLLELSSNLLFSKSLSLKLQACFLKVEGVEFFDSEGSIFSSGVVIIHGYKGELLDFP